MPYLQLDVPGSFPLEVKRDLARKLGALYAEIMQTTPDKVSVAIRELAQGSLWRCGEGPPEPAAVLMCDVRRGRPPEQRARLAQELVAACVQALGLRPDRLAVEFTQHAGDEMYRDGRLATDWSPAEGTSSS
ncbi:MAG: 4-oxalocrotonate tautomerase family protein [Chloroflexota bacterium]